MSGLLRQSDRFSESITLNHQGSSKFQTKCGGFVSLAIFATIAAFTAARFTKMIELSEPSLYEVTQGLDLLADDSPEYKLSENSLTLGFMGTFAEYIYDGDG